MRVIVNLFELLGVLAVLGIFGWMWVTRKLAARRERKLTERLQKAAVDIAKQ
jgi:hypothetical protein